MRLDPELYWGSTPREIHACFIAYYREKDIERQMFGTVVAAVYNALRPGKDFITWQAVFPPVTNEAKPAPRTRADTMAAWNASHKAYMDGAIKQ